MKIIETKCKCEQFNSKILDSYLGNYSYASFDIETTGLNPKYSKIILAGLFFFDKDKNAFISRQILAENQSEEKELLLELKRQLQAFDYVLTFNGRHFDMRFIMERYKKYKILFQPPLYDLDIYLILNGYSDLKAKLPNLKQKTVEKFLGIDKSRDDEINGKESIILYNEYEATGDPILEKVILLHNSDDIYQLYQLQKVLAYADIHKAFTKLGFPVTSPTFGPLQIGHIKISGNQIEVDGIQYAHEAQNYLKFSDMENGISLAMDSATREFKLSIPVVRQYGGAYVQLNSIGLSDKDVAHLPGYVKGYLVVENKNQISHIDLNNVIKKVLESF